MIVDLIFQLLERALDECGYDLNAAIKILHELSLGYAAGNPDSAEKLNANMEKGTYIKVSMTDRDGGVWDNFFDFCPTFGPFISCHLYVVYRMS